jgi:biotin carboxylase
MGSMRSAAAFSPPSVLMLGLDRYVLRACVRHDVEAVAVCSHTVWDSGLDQIPDGIAVMRVDDQASVESVLTALHRAGLAGHRFDAIYTTDEWALVTASVLGQILGCRSADPAMAVHLRDKSLQKARVRAAGIPAARAEVIDDIFDVRGHETLSFPRAVLKPIAGAGTIRTSVVEDGTELRDRSRRYRFERARERTYILEEFVDGEEWIADGVVFGREVLFFGLARYSEPCLTTLNHRRVLTTYRMDPDADGGAYAAAEPVVRGALAALGMADGVFHMELFHETGTGRVIFSECAGRRGGGLTHEEVQRKFNVDLGEAALLCALGQRPALTHRAHPDAVGCAFLQGRPGILISHPMPADFLALPGVEFARVRSPYGTRLPGEAGSTGERLAELLITSDSTEGILRRAEELRVWFDEQLIVVPAGATTAELRRWQAETWPDAPARNALYWPGEPRAPGRPGGGEHRLPNN